MKLTLQDRVSVKQLTEAGFNSPTIAQQLGCSVTTVRYWRRKFRRQGVLALTHWQGRPIKGALSTYPDWVRQRLFEYRQSHPGWGPKTLRAQLQSEGIAACFIPSRASIARWLAHQGLAYPYHRHSQLPTVAVPVASAPHEEWEMDACGPETVANVGKIALINLNDVATRTKLLSFACWVGQQRVTRHPNTADYQLALRLAFTQWGLPQRLSVDHDSVFFDNQTPSPYPTRWHLWLLALGVTVCFGRVHCPTDQAVTERSHQTWYHQVLEGQRFDTLDHLQHALDDRREFLNTHLPCRSLAEQPPLLAYPEARQSQRPYRPEWEAHLLDLHRVYDYLAKGVWYRRMSNVGAFSLGGQVYVAGLPWARQQVEIFFDPQDCHLVVTAPAVKLTKRFSLKGVTPQELMGELGPLAHLSEFQLALPFTWPDVRVLKPALSRSIELLLIIHETLATRRLYSFE